MLRSTVRTTVLLLMLFSVLPAWADYDAGQQAWDAGRTDEALVQWKTAAATGDRRAMHTLGRLYLQGLGALQDYVEAHKWLNLAASRGEAAARAERDALAAKMTPAQVAEAQALARAWRPSGSQAASKTEETTAAAEPAPSANADGAPTLALGPTCAAAEEGSECWKELADEPGCHVWDERHYSDQTVTWSGRCAGGVIVGEGTLVWTRDGKLTEWTGMASGGKRHGHWVIRHPLGTMEGPYVDGKEHGHWVVRTSAGNAAEGPYVEGMKQGNWVESRADGSVWQGPYVDGSKHGRWYRTGEDGCAFNEFKRDELGDSGVLAMAECPSLDIAAADGAVVSESHDGGPLTEAAEEAEADTRHKGQAELALKPGHVFRDCEACPEMVVVPAGSFMMGSPSHDEERTIHDIPQHPVTIAAPFAVGRYEVTFDEWDACVAAGGCGGHRPADEGWSRGRRPVIHVSWDDAKAYADWLAQETGEWYRLLSEAEWEYVARAGTTTQYSWGDEIGRNRANCDGCGSRRYNKQTAPVGSFPVNDFGLHDVHGNVWEWVEDCWHENYRGAPSDGSAWTSGGDCSGHVMRGGGWYNPPFILRISGRNWSKSGNRVSDGLGFRVARSLIATSRGKEWPAARTADPAWGRDVEPAAPSKPFGPNWIVVENQPCQIWNSDPVEGETATWTGGCVDGKASGGGRTVWKGSYGTEPYEGARRAGKMHGLGTYTWANGNRYEGEFVDGERTGLGTYTWADGERYEGEWRDGEEHGLGTYTSPDGSRYEGEWRDDKKHGLGTYTWPDGSRYEGGWRDGKTHGRGTNTWADGVRYEGGWHDDKRHGRGTNTWPDGSRYEGEWRDGKPHGRGVYVSNDHRYEGDWTRGCFGSRSGRWAAVITTAKACGFK